MHVGGTNAHQPALSRPDDDTQSKQQKVQWTCTCSSRTRDATPLPAVASKAKARPRRLHHGSSARRAAPPPAFDGSFAARGRGERPKARGDQVGGGSVTEGASPAPPVPRGGATCASERPPRWVEAKAAWRVRGRLVARREEGDLPAASRPATKPAIRLGSRRSKPPPPPPHAASSLPSRHTRRRSTLPPPRTPPPSRARCHTRRSRATRSSAASPPSPSRRAAPLRARPAAG
mmetsp:Transcript_14380/g.46837  ORF Transcript_14380/g.46837 Transcript_14380/m.46837 type:complete len:233 (-) Transcript_14380:8-706(-)